MSGARVYVGNLPSRATDRDLEHFFKSFGRIRDVVLKSGFGFVEFDDPRDADDAVHEQNGRELMGNRVSVEISRRPSGRFSSGGRDGGYRGGGGRDNYRDSRGGEMTADGRINGRFPPPMKTRYRMIVTNLSSRCSWQEIKDMMRLDGKANVTYAEAHQRTRNEANLCFSSHDDLRRAMEKFQDKEINGRRIKIVDDTEGGGGGSGRHRSRSRTRSRSHSRSARSRSRSRSRSARRSRSRSPPSGSRSRSGSKGSKKSKSGSPAKNGGKADGDAKKRARTPPGSRSRSRSRSRSAHSPAASPDNGKGGGKAAAATPEGSASPGQKNGKEAEVDGGKSMEE